MNRNAVEAVDQGRYVTVRIPSKLVKEEIKSTYSDGRIEEIIRTHAQSHHEVYVPAQPNMESK